MARRDPYDHKVVALRAGGRRLELAASQELFSSHQVDRGTRLLLRTLRVAAGEEIAGRSVLDVGCGYGPLGLALRAMGSARAVLVDRDALAVHYALRNATENAIDGIQAHGSLGYDDVVGRFGLLVANLPGHASPAVVAHLVAAAGEVLDGGGIAGFVVVEPLAGEVEAALAGTAGAAVRARVEDRGHSVWIAEFDGTARVSEDGGWASGLGLYRRGEVEVSHGDRSWRVATATGVPEFERLSHHTAGLLDHLVRARRRGQPEAVAVWNPGQGHVAIWLAMEHELSTLVLADRDLLALRATDANLTRNSVRPPSTRLVHDIEVVTDDGREFDLIIDVLRRSEPAAAAAARIAAARTRLAAGGELIVSGPAVRVRRVAAALAEEGIAARQVSVRRATLLEVVG